MSAGDEQRMAYLGFRIIMPPPILRPWVQSFWVVNGTPAPATHAEEYMHPGGGFGLVFNLNESGAKLDLDGDALPESVFLDGTTTRSRRMGFAGPVQAVGIRFVPGGAYPFINVPLNLLGDQTTVLDALTRRREVLTLHEQVVEATTLPDRLQRLETWLIRQLRHTDTASPVVAASLNRLHGQAGIIGMKALADQLHISQRQLERLYQVEVGMTPKQYACLLRVEQARMMLRQKRYQSAADVGAALGYYDQAHFTRDFGTVVGMTPGQYRERGMNRARQNHTAPGDHDTLPG